MSPGYRHYPSGGQPAAPSADQPRAATSGTDVSPTAPAAAGPVAPADPDTIYIGQLLDALAAIDPSRFTVDGMRRNGAQFDIASAPVGAGYVSLAFPDSQDPKAKFDVQILVDREAPHLSEAYQPLWGTRITDPSQIHRAAEVLGPVLNVSNAMGAARARQDMTDRRHQAEQLTSAVNRTPTLTGPAATDAPPSTGAALAQ